MRTTILRAAMMAAMVGLVGCSGSDESQVSGVSTGETLAAASSNSTPTLGSTKANTSSTTAASNGGTNVAPSKREPFRNPFAPPKDPPPPPVVEQPEPEPAATPEPAPEIRQPGVPPKIRLLGFMHIGEPKVLVSLHDELETLAIGDTLEDMKVVKIESPDLTMLFDEREVKFRLFEQAWRHEGGSASGNRGVQTRPRSTRPTRSTSTSPPVGATVGVSTTDASGIPGFAPNAGKPPGFQRPTSPRTGSTPGAPIGSPPPSLPGLSSEASGAGAGDGGFPGIPGLEVDAGGKLGAGNLPALPGGL